MQNPSGTKCRRKTIRIPDYTLGEELVNSISHGAGALFGIAALVLMLLKARGALQVVTVSLFGASIILVYSVSCIYHALSRRTGGKKVLRVIDHCNSFSSSGPIFRHLSWQSAAGPAGFCSGWLLSLPFWESR